MIEVDGSALLAAMVLGAIGAGHCVGMCGGIIGALSFSLSGQSQAKRWLLLLGYNLGRIGSYSLMGAGMAAVIASMPESPWPLTRTLAGALLVLMGLYMAGWWRVLAHLERLGGHLWRRVKPLGNRLMPIDSLPKTLALGALWGWLPCGLVYSALAYAAAQPTGLGGALVMLSFGLGTLPAVLLGGMAAAHLRQWLAKKSLRNLLGLAFMGFGLWTLLQAWGHVDHHGPEPHHDQRGAPAEVGAHPHH